MGGMERAFPTASVLAILLLLPVFLAGCVRPDPEVTIVVTSAAAAQVPSGQSNISSNISLDQVVEPSNALPTPTAALPAISPDLPTYEGIPTPDPTRARDVTSDGRQLLSHTVQRSETLGSIARYYGSNAQELMALNNLTESDFLQVGQVLRVPGDASLVSPAFKIIPDSELVYGPAAAGFDVRQFAERFGGYLLRHEEVVEGRTVTGPQIVQLVADRYSVNPRLLLAALEYRSGWLTQAGPNERRYPMGKAQAGYEGLYKQLTWAADQLNWGYYGRAEGGVTSFTLADGTRARFSPGLNDGTTGVQFWLGVHSGATYDRWLHEVSPAGFYAAYARLFGNPFAYSVDPLWPEGLSQPLLTLPWAVGETWYFTGGPHGGWASGSAWAALDFVPHHEQLGCYASDAWVRAMAPGVVTRSDFGAVVVDLDGDGYAGTGWAITYMHLETRDRIQVGMKVRAGDPLGHPSCEGGFSNGTHVHLARTYNGRWVAADGEIPFSMGGWTSVGLGREYDGQLIRGNEIKEACECRGEGNAITVD